jgi:hypothetical protein
MAVIGLGRFHETYIEWGARMLGFGSEQPSLFGSFVSRLEPGELIIRGDATSTVVVESEEHLKSLSSASKNTCFYAVREDVSLDRIMTTSNSRLNAMELAQIMKEKKAEGLFSYVKKEEDGKERKRG